MDQEYRITVERDGRDHLVARNSDGEPLAEAYPQDGAPDEAVRVALRTLAILCLHSSDPSTA